MNETRTVSRDSREIDAIVSRHKGEQGELLGILEEAQLQNEHRFLSEDTLSEVALRTGVPLSRIYNVVTFYSFFNLKPQGEHTVTVCRGTACHTKGSKVLLDDLGMLLGGSDALESGESVFTTPDKKFTVSTVACFGQCALAPVVAVDGIIYSNMTSAKVKKLLDGIARRSKKP